MKTIAILVVLVVSSVTQISSEQCWDLQEVFGVIEISYPNSASKHKVNAFQRYEPMQIWKWSKILLPNGSYIGVMWELEWNISEYDLSNMDVQEYRANPRYFYATVVMPNVTVVNNKIDSGFLQHHSLSVINQYYTSRLSHLVLYEKEADDFDISSLFYDPRPQPVAFLSFPTPGRLID